MAGRKLLLADDSITIQKVVNLTFADEGVEVITVGDGDSAIQRLSEVLPDIVLADVNMPGLTGYQVCELIRSDPKIEHLPVVLLVGAFEQFDDAEAARVGASAHLTKPFQSIRQLVNIVSDLIESSRSALHSAEQAATAAGPEPEPYTIQPATPIDPFEAPVPATFEDTDLAHSPSNPDPLEEGSQVSVRENPEPDPVGEPDDIDRLYRQSIGEEPLGDGQGLPDLGLDDEMIETSYTAPQAPSDELELQPPDQDLSGTIYQRPAEPVAEAQSPRSAYETTELSPDDLAGVMVPATQPERDETVRLDPAMVDARMAEENRRLESADDQSRNVGTAAIGEDTIRMNSRFDNRHSGSYEFDEADLLDIPIGTEVVISSPAETAAVGGKQVVTLSPELIEMIAQRVVEKLAERH